MESEAELGLHGRDGDEGTKVRRDKGDGIF
jgi:hypothetical protein